MLSLGDITNSQILIQKGSQGSFIQILLKIRDHCFQRPVGKINVKKQHLWAVCMPYQERKVGFSCQMSSVLVPPSLFVEEMHHTQMLWDGCHLMIFCLLLASPVSLPKGRECSDHGEMSVLIPEMSKSSYKLSDSYLFANALQIKLATYPALDVRESSTPLAVLKVTPFACLPNVLGPRH